jgi:hypothetical protein
LRNLLKRGKDLMGTILENKLAAIFSLIGGILIVLSQVVKSLAVVFWIAALLAFVIALGFAGSAYAQHKRQKDSA